MQDVIEFISKHPLLSVAWVGLLIAMLVINVRLLFSKVKFITRAQAVTLINKEDAVIVDLRAIEAFNSAHIVDAINLIPSEIKDNNIGQLNKHKERPIIVVDANGMNCRASAQALMLAGFPRVYMLKGGIAAWTEGNMPLVRRKHNH